MKKVLKITILILLIISIIGVIYYYAPILQNKKKEKTLAVIKENNSVFISKIIEESSKNKDMLPSLTARKVVEELNSIQKNPYDNSKDYYVMNSDCTACAKVECDDNLKMIIITTLDKKESLVARTVINPPSFVTFYKDDK